eukprot:6172529-Pleurochrysis_carterae.AAC.2
MRRSQYRTQMRVERSTRIAQQRSAVRTETQTSVASDSSMSYEGGELRFGLGLPTREKQLHSSVGAEARFYILVVVPLHNTQYPIHTYSYSLLLTKLLSRMLPTGRLVAAASWLWDEFRTSQAELDSAHCWLNGRHTSTHLAEDSPAHFDSGPWLARN